MKKTLFAAFAAFILVGCNGNAPVEEATKSGLLKKNFQTEHNGKQTDLYVLTNASGMEVCITNYGGRIASILVADKDGKMRDVSVGFDSIQDHISVPGNNYGALIGRYGNRIGNATFEIDGVKYELPKNNYGHCLHGGDNGFHTAVWDAKQVDNSTLELTYLSKDGEEGFPGNLTCKVVYYLGADNDLHIKYEAETDKPTVVNLTNHCYFNMDGDVAVKNSDWLLYLNADQYTPVDSTFMTTGEILTVEGNDMDFRTPTAIGKRIDNFEFDQLKNGMGYDHNWVLNTKGDITKVAATLESPASGIAMDVFTTEPGVQFYAGNFMTGDDKGKKGVPNGHRGAVCLETQKYPDTPNKKDWPSAELRPGEKYTTETIYKFYVKK